jgi:hypothetical protein
MTYSRTPGWLRTRFVEMDVPWAAVPFAPEIDQLHWRLLGRARRGYDIHPAVVDEVVDNFAWTVSRVSAQAVAAGLRIRGAQGDPAERAAWDALWAGCGPTVPASLRRRIDMLADVYANWFALLLDRANETTHAEPGSRGLQPCGKLVSVEIMGDMHVRGAVSFVRDEWDRTSVYKPRSMAVDGLLVEVLSELREICGGVVPAHPRHWDGGGYGWQERIVYDSPASPDEVNLFYERIGAWCAILAALRAYDVHYENMVCQGPNPYLIDAECLFQAPLLGYVDAAELSLLNQFETVLASGLLPNWTERGKHLGPADQSVLGAFAQRAPSLITHRLRFGHGVAPVLSAEIVREQTFANLPDQTQPEYRVASHSENVAVGFEQVACAIAGSAGRRILDRVHIARDLTGRFLPRPTWQYMAALGKPDIVEPVEQRPHSVEAEMSEASPAVGHCLSEWIRAREIDALRRGCVPLFERDLRDGSLWADGAPRFDGKLAAPLVSRA